MTKSLRMTVVLLTTGLVWFAALRFFFVISGAQSILADPSKQSSKFINAFIGNPPARMAVDPGIVWKGLMIVGTLLAVAFIIINNYLNGNWIKRGLIFGFVHWLMMTPWFEFYPPYNIMLEPMPLVLFEGALWLALTLCVGLWMSFVMNFRRV